jgi:hypothetical protein
MGGILLVVVWTVPLVGLAVILILRKPLRRRLFAGTGLAEWQRTAQRLSWRERIRLERANSRGRATTPELAPLAVQRGRTMSALIEHAQAKPFLRRVFPAMAVLMALLVVANVALLLTDQTDWHHVWLTVLLGTVLVVMYAAMPHLQRRQLRKFRRSVELNEALLKSPPPSSSL